jgi:hypothetical protein
MWRRKTAQRAQPDWGFSEPEPPTGGEAYTDLLCEVGTVFIFYFVYIFSNNLLTHFFYFFE